MASSRVFDVPEADLVLINGKVLTLDPQDTIIEAVAVKGGRILTTGTTPHILKMAGERTEIIDFKGRVALPGFIDTHTHPSQAARRL